MKSGSSALTLALCSPLSKSLILLTIFVIYLHVSDSLRHV
ncbi:Uncharacterised protein [Vibrio cholerae]|nr:Uncharacterised protein [Vibrio cholerae]